MQILSSHGSSRRLLYRCIDKVSMRLVMLKRVPKSSWTLISKGEFGYLMALDHPNIVRYLDCFENETHWLILMEHCEDHLVIDGRHPGALQEDEVRLIGKQILSGLLFLHKNHVVHCDIKPGNILKDGRGVIKIADFGEAQLRDGRRESEAPFGTPAYLAPECLTSSQIHPSRDVWAFGCVLYYLLTGKNPWKGHTDMQVFALLQAGAVPFDLEALECSEACKTIIRTALARDPGERPSVSLLSVNQFFSNGLA